MKKRELELIYMDYLNSLKSVREDLAQKETYKYKINPKLKEKIMEKFKQPLPVFKEKETKTKGIKEGQVYLMFKNNVPIFFVVIDEIDDLYEVLKISNYVELANQNDLITNINGENYIVEVWNKFYLTEDEIKDSIFYGMLSEEDLKILRDYKEDRLNELPVNKRGLTVPLNKNYFQIKFHQQESRLVREYELRIFLLMEEEE